MPKQTPLDTIEKALAELTAGEKAHLLQRVARELGGGVPGIDLEPSVCGGESSLLARGFLSGSWCRPGDSAPPRQAF
jgi:hypothetical protein